MSEVLNHRKEGAKKRRLTILTRYGQFPKPWLGKKRSVETIAKVSIAKKGSRHTDEWKKQARLRQLEHCKNPNYIKKTTHAQTEETRRKISEGMKKWRQTTRGREGARMAGKLGFQKTGLLNRFHHRRPTSPEKQFMEINRKYDLGFRYNGDFREGIVIGNKIPDFIKEESKFIVEVFSYYYHSPIFNVNVRYHQTEQGTIEHYAKHGYRCVVLWQSYNKRLEMSEQEIIAKLEELKVNV